MKTKLDKYRKYFTDLGVSDETKMIAILEYLDAMADICYDNFLLQKE